MKNYHGMTLIELMIVVAILAIIGSIAMTSYDQSVRKARRSGARAALVEAAARQEQYFNDNKTYTANMADLKMISPDGDGKYMTENDYYEITIPAGTTTTYTVTATAKNAQLKDSSCRTFTINQNGTKEAKDSSNVVTTDECW